mmetsp:Transcript_27227/g.45784  ORF Transcript_27227/g.45784 Transcript_27227/m.45784 type:complete len:201 (+) Transcript_27227:482-1084(+)
MLSSPSVSSMKFWTIFPEGFSSCISSKPFKCDLTLDFRCPNRSKAVSISLVSPLGLSQCFNSLYVGKRAFKISTFSNRISASLSKVVNETKVGTFVSSAVFFCSTRRLNTCSTVPDPIADIEPDRSITISTKVAIGGSSFRVFCFDEEADLAVTGDFAVLGSWTHSFSSTARPPLLEVIPSRGFSRLRSSSFLLTVLVYC